MSRRMRSRLTHVQDLGGYMPIQNWTDGTHHESTSEYVPSVPVHSGGDIIYDETGSGYMSAFGGSQVRLFKTTDHRSRHLEGVRASRNVRFSTNPSWGTTTWSGDSWLEHCLLKAGGGLADLGDAFCSKVDGIPASYPWDQIFDSLKPTMATRANLAVFLYELRDLKRMWEFMPPKHFNVRNWHEVLMYANNQHLNYNFGWRPFIRDVKNIWKGLDTFGIRLQRFLRESGRDLRRARSRTYTSAVDIQDYWTYPPKEEERFFLSGTLEDKIALTCDMAYQVPDYGRDELKLRALADTLGASINLANIWAVIPWSFVADWFVRIGPYLDHTTSDDWLQPAIEIYQSCFSVKRTFTGDFGWVTPSADGHVKLVAVHGSYRHYHRHLGIPTSGIRGGTLDADKIRLGSSLLLSLWR